MKVIAAGLPEIAGKFGTYSSDWRLTSNGAFIVSIGVGYRLPATAQEKFDSYATYSFSANKSNPVYGNAQTVQPPALVLIPQIKT